MNLKEKKVIYIEDNATNRFLMEMVFSNFDGFSLDLAVDAEQGLGGIYSNAFDVILMDKNLPKMSGLDAIKELKSNPQYHSIPIIMLTADRSEETVALALSAGCAQVFGKPFDIARLKEKIRELASEDQLD